MLHYIYVTLNQVHTNYYGFCRFTWFTLLWLVVESVGMDTIHAEKGCMEMRDFHMAGLMFLTGHEIKARTHAHVEITHFLTQCIIRTWKALGLQPHNSQAGMMHLIGKCVISIWAWVLAKLHSSANCSSSSTACKSDPPSSSSSGQVSPGDDGLPDPVVLHTQLDFCCGD